jgi:integrase
MPRLTQKFIETKVVRPTSGQIFYRDDILCGFALRVTSGSMSYVAECKVNGKTRRITIGQHGRLTPELARKEARKLLAAMSTGHDPKEDEARRKTASITLAEVLEKYLDSRSLRPNSIRSFRQVLRRCLGDWLNKPIRSITKDMVEARHRELTRITRQGTTGKAQANMAIERLGILLNFAMNNFEIDGQPVILFNPVRRLSQNRGWHHVPRRQTIIPDYKLADWYRSVIILRKGVVRDYLLFLLFTGFRRNEAATLRWDDIDFNDKVVRVRAELAKNRREHRLPLSDFLLALLQCRKRACGESNYVFPGRGGRHHLVDSGHVIEQVARNSGCRFILHDLRRTFMTTAEKLDVPHYVLKKLANHVSSRDVTAGYIVVEVERLRIHMEKISEHFLFLMKGSIEDLSGDVGLDEE